jgi:hypothetical protein
MGTLDATDPTACNRYRIAYGHAARLLEMSRFDHSWGLDFARRVGPEQIRAEVAGECPAIPPELVELAVADAVAGRRPRW